MNIFTETCGLNDEGKLVAAPLCKALKDIFETNEVKDMSSSEIRAFGATLSKIVGDTISNKLQEKLDKNIEVFKMTDGQFIDHLKSKYGPHYMLRTVTEEEYNRLAFISNDFDLKEKI